MRQVILHTTHSLKQYRTIIIFFFFLEKQTNTHTHTHTHTHKRDRERGSNTKAHHKLHSKVKSHDAKLDSN